MSWYCSEGLTLLDDEDRPSLLKICGWWGGGGWGVQVACVFLRMTCLCDVAIQGCHKAKAFYIHRLHFNFTLEMWSNNAWMCSRRGRWKQPCVCVYMAGLAGRTTKPSPLVSKPHRCRGSLSKRWLELTYEKPIFYVLFFSSLFFIMAFIELLLYLTVIAFIFHRLLTCWSPVGGVYAVCMWRYELGLCIWFWSCLGTEPRLFKLCVFYLVVCL